MKQARGVRAPHNTTLRTGDDVLDGLIEVARAQGWTVERTKSGHIRFRPADPSRRVVVTAGTPSDWRSRANLAADLRRQGLEVGARGGARRDHQRDPDDAPSSGVRRYYETVEKEGKTLYPFEISYRTDDGFLRRVVIWSPGDPWGSISRALLKRLGEFRRVSGPVRGQWLPFYDAKRRVRRLRPPPVGRAGR